MSRFEIDRLIAHRDLETREKTHYRVLHETARRAEEIVGLNIKDLDVPAQRAQIQAKGRPCQPRRRRQTRDDLVLKTGMRAPPGCFPALLKAGTHGPVFAHIADRPWQSGPAPRKGSAGHRPALPA